MNVSDVVGFDNLGLGVENPHYEETPIRNPARC